MTANTPILLTNKAQQGIIEFFRQCNNLTNNRWNLRERLRQIDLSYIREKDWTEENQKAKIANAYGDATRLQNYQIPVVLPAVEAAVTYQTSVFLTGSPIFGVVASPQYADQALQMETVLDDQAVLGGWKSQLTLAFRDGFKYNLAAVECDWQAEVTAALETDLAFSAKEARPKEVIWEGNTVRRWDLYNSFFDTRVTPSEMHMRGEFVGNTRQVSRIELKQFINRLPNKMVANIQAAFESGIGGLPLNGESNVQSYYIPYINPDALINKNTWGQTDWMAWVGAAKTDNNVNIRYQNTYYLTTLYARILPSDFGIRVPSPNTPQVWKFYIVNGQVLIYAERQTNAHGYIPVLMFQPLEDGLEYQTRSLADNVRSIQEISSALMTSVIAARRRAISDRGLYDPSRVTEAHINSANPSAKIPVRPAAYGKPLSEAYYPIPFRDDQSQLMMQQIGQMNQFAYVVTGQNPARQGQFVKGNKTRAEYEDVQGNANGRDQLVAIHLEDKLFTPLKTILKSNILQYQGGISLFNRERQKEVQIDPVALRKAIMEFKISDGLIPSEKLINGEDFGVALQVIGSSPQISGGYNIAPMFSYLMKSRGLRLADFEKSREQQAYEQAVGQYQALIQQLVKDGATPEQIAAIPQPLPEQFGYSPNGQATNQPVQ